LPESLSVIAELGIGLAGFSGVVVAFGQRSRELHTLDRIRVVGLLIGSLGSALGATLPILLYDVGLSDTAVWQASSTAMTCLLVGFVANSRRSLSSLSSSQRQSLHPAIWVAVMSGVALLIPVQVANVMGWIVGPSSGPYLAALYFLIVYACVQFFRLLLVRPREIGGE
jgi:hypothetical protein